MSTPCCLTCECGPHEAEEQAFEAMREALRRVEGIAQHARKGGRDAIEAMRDLKECESQARAALALADKVNK